ncbi:hypothetical protein AAG906_028083 [Vitis piasezkii]
MTIKVVRSLEVERNLEWVALSLGVGGKKVKVATIAKASMSSGSTSVVLFNKMQALRNDLNKWNRRFNGIRMEDEEELKGGIATIKLMFKHSQENRLDIATNLFKGIEALDKDLIEGFSWRMRCYLPSRFRR